MIIFIEKMDKIFKIIAKCLSPTKKLFKLTLDLLENCHSYFFSIINSQNILPKQLISKIPSFEIQLQSYSPFTLISFGIALIFFYYFLKMIFQCFSQCINFFANIKENLTILYCKLPGPRAQLEDAKKKISEEFRKMLSKRKYQKIEFYDNKQDYTKILSKMEKNYSGDNAKIECGKLTGSVYCVDDQIKYIAGEATKMFLYSNLLHPAIYSYTRYIEAELIKLGVQLFNGGEDACGMTTNGGSMSLINAIFAYVNRGRKLGIKNPELIISITAHVAIEKACDLFGVKCIKLPLDEKYQIDLNLVEKNINKNTICLIGSFPNFPHCIGDDIEQLSKLGLKYNIPVHVDCCLGGFLVCFHERAGIMDTPKFDFRLPGVTSISADLHKYGLCPKGISLIMFSKHEYRRNLYFVYPHWPGSTYITPGFEGSRTGALIAASFAILTSMGKEFYANNAKKINEAVIKVKEFIKKECDLIQVIGDPFICGVSFTGKYIPHFYDMICEKGFDVNYLNKPEGVGFIFTSANVDNADNYMKALKEINDKLKKEKPAQSSEKTKLYGLSYSLPLGIASNALECYPDVMLDS